MLYYDSMLKLDSMLQHDCMLKIGSMLKFDSILQRDSMLKCDCILQQGSIIKIVIMLYHDSMLKLDITAWQELDKLKLKVHLSKEGLCLLCGSSPFSKTIESWWTALNSAYGRERSRTYWAILLCFEDLIIFTTTKGFGMSIH